MRWTKWLPSVIWAALILTVSNDYFSLENTEAWVGQVTGGESAEIANIAMRKTGHILGYGILGVLAWIADRRVAIPILFAMLIAVVDETNQGLTRFREGSPFDVVLDTLSAALFVLVLERVRWARNRIVKR